MIRILKKREELPEIIREIIGTYKDAEFRLHHLGETPLPNEDVIANILGKLRTILFPGYFGREYVNPTSVDFYIGELLFETYELLTDEIYKALSNVNAEKCQEKAEEVCLKFMRIIPDLRRRLALDVEAAMEGDPAAKSYDEVIFSYPGMTAITVYRIAHELHLLKVPLIPRIMTEYAHRRTGIDIHPGASIGRWFFIDHGTGVVIGETTQIGDRVKIYQGVTLGALSFREGVEEMRHTKRHPTIHDNVVIYAGATILGGDTVIGQDSVIGGNVWIINSVPPKSKVMMEVPRLKIMVNE
ncbi:MAG: serine O-acetyltransferase EpsC [Acidobacteriota bacterium]